MGETVEKQQLNPVVFPQPDPGLLSEVCGVAQVGGTEAVPGGENNRLMHTNLGTGRELFTPRPLVTIDTKSQPYLRLFHALQTHSPSFMRVGFPRDSRK